MINTFIATHTATREFFTELINASSDSSELWFFDDSFVPMEKLEPIDIIELDYIIQHEFYSAASNGVFIDKDVLYRKAHMWYSYFIHHLSGRTLIVWNGLPLILAAAVTAARILGSKVVFMELGSLPATLLVDSCGVNMYSSVALFEDSFFTNQEIEDVLLERLYNEPLIQRQSDCVISEDSVETLPERFILFPSQVHNDTQLTHGSDRFKSSIHAACVISEALDRYNKKYASSMSLVVKTHPNDYIYSRDIFQKVLPKQIVLSSTPIDVLLTKTDAVITINSTVGLEARLRNIPVITLGKCIYSRITHQAKDDLVESIEDIYLKQLDIELAQHFLYYLKYKYFIDVTTKNKNKKILKRISDLQNE